MLIHHDTIQPFTRKARRRSLVSQTKTLFIEKPWLNVLFFVISVFWAGESEIQIKDGPGSSRQWPRYCLKPVQQPNT